MAYAAEQDQNKKDLDAMQGSWVIQKWLNAGISAPANALGSVFITFKGDQAIHMGDVSDPATIKLDSSKDPATIDFIDKTKSVERGIYKFDGDILTFCIAMESSAARPTVFESNRNNGYMLVVMKRQTSMK
jgi:uncharacterized protein (TIGR03067 family)